MNTGEAVKLLGGAVPGVAGTWADLGAGRGVFTRALIERLGAGSRIYSVDRDASVVAAVQRMAEATPDVKVMPVVADLTRPFELPGPGGEKLDGILLANALHFVRDPEAVLAGLVELVRPGGRVVIIEYDGRGPNRWVPYPIPRARLPARAEAAGLSSFTVTATRRSAYGGTLYAGVAERP